MNANALDLPIINRGAYRRFKDFLEQKDLLQSWYDFENQREEEALREWARDNKIELEPYRTKTS